MTLYIVLLTTPSLTPAFWLLSNSHWQVGGFFFFVIYLLVICLFSFFLFLHSDWSFSSFFSSQYPHLPSVPTPSTSLPFHDSQQNMAYPVTVRLRTSPCIKAGQGEPVWGTGFQKLTKTDMSVQGPYLNRLLSFCKIGLLSYLRF